MVLILWESARPTPTGCSANSSLNDVRRGEAQGSSSAGKPLRFASANRHDAVGLTVSELRCDISAYPECLTQLLTPKRCLGGPQTKVLCSTGKVCEEPNIAFLLYISVLSRAGFRKNSSGRSLHTTAPELEHGIFLL